MAKAFTVVCNKKYCGVQGKLREMQNSEAVAMLGSSVGAIK
jgi:peroxiredoxin